MPNKKEEALVKIKKVGEKDNKFWVQDEKGEYYSGFKSYQGSENTEYSQLQLGNHGEPFKVGDTALVVFTKSVGKDDKIYKNIRGIYPAEGSQTAPQAKTSSGEAPVASERLSEAEFSRRLGVQGHVNALLSNPNILGIGNLSVSQFQDLISHAIQIEDEINKQLNPSKLRQAVQKHAPSVAEELPVIQQDEDVPPPSDMDVEGIPF
jgi:hypothetical protein